MTASVARAFIIVVVAVLVAGTVGSPPRVGEALVIRYFPNTTVVEIPDYCLFCVPDLRAKPYPSSVEVSGYDPGAVVDRVWIDLKGLTHTNPDDIDILLATPEGVGVTVFSDAGGGGDVSNLELTITTSEGTTLPDSGPLGSGPYHPENYEGQEVFPEPAPSPYGSVGDLAGTPANGTWSLYIVDDSVGADDEGTLSGGWQLGLSVNEAPEIRLPSPAPTYRENAAPVLLDQGATVADLDTQSYGGGSLDVSWSNLTAVDSLTIRNQGSGAGLIGTLGDKILFGGEEIANFSGGDGKLLHIFFNSSDATPAAVQALLRNLAFSVGSESPSALDRSVTFELTTFRNFDGQASVSKLVHVQPVADTPFISAIADQSVVEDSSTATLAFTIGDVDTPLGGLSVSATASDAGILPAAGIKLGGTGATRTVKLTPAANANGTLDVTINVSDGGETASEKLRLVVTAVPDPTLLRLVKRGSGGGIVTSTPGGVNCGADCSQTYEINTTVRLKAKPRLHSFFVGWSGGGCRGRGECVMSLRGSTTVEARFVRPTCVGKPATRVGVGAIRGTDRDDVLVGTAGPNRILGRGGNDLICSGGGNDVADAGPGNDVVQSAGGRDHLTGGPGNDTLNGGGADDRLIGGTGVDQLFGDAGNDVLNGGPGASDRCSGGPGIDVLAAADGCETVIGVP